MKLISYILSVIFGFVFFILLLIFHPLQWIALKLFGYKAHNHVVSLLNLFIVRSLLILGINVKFENKYKLPQNSTLSEHV
jgi:1-acyl-sn-glycerol-3-phosphate acyltransferase